MAPFLLLLAVSAPWASLAAGSQQRSAANPIRKVVAMLQKMQAKVQEEGEKEQALFDKFMCYCKKSGSSLKESIADAEIKITSVSSSLKENTEKKGQTEQSLEEHQTSRSDAKEAMEKATAIREKEAAAYAAVDSDYAANIAALTKAIAAIEKGAGSAFLQTAGAAAVRSYALEKATLPDQSRQELLAFLSGSEGSEYAPKSGQITGILKQMKDEMVKSSGETTAAEQEAIATHEALMAAKKKEAATLTKQIEEEMLRIGEAGVEVAEMKNDLEDTQASLAGDQKFVAELEAGCDTKGNEWEEIKKLRAQETLALADTIKVLNDDEALDLFKKTLPSASASFVQVKVSAAAQRTQALAVLREARRNSAALSAQPEFSFLMLALRGKKIGFEKVSGMIDEMVGSLKTEQKSDDDKKEYCNAEFDGAEDKKKGLEQSVSDSAKTIENLKGSIATLVEEIAALEAGIKALDKSVTEATENRKAEHKDYSEMMSSDATAKELLQWALNNLNKFYNPKLYKAPTAPELSESEQITKNFGGEVPTAAPGGIAGTGIGAVFVQVSAHDQEKAAPPPPPETFSAYSKKSEESAGVTAMVNLLIKDLDKEMAEAKVEEKDSQKDYEAMMAESAKKRAQDAKSVSDKSAAKASQDEMLGAEMDKKAGTQTELMATDKYIHSLHGECDWLLQYFDARKEARTNEIDSLGKAKDVLSGSDYSLAQTGRAARTLRGTGQHVH